MKTIERNQERAFTIDTRGMDKEVRMVPAALSSETPVERFFGTEILTHEQSSVNMERAATGLPLLFSHDRERPIGRVQNIRVESDKVLRGDLYFSKNADAESVWGDVSEGFLRDLSIGYRIDEYEEMDEDVIRVTQFTPLEVSVVTVPADSRVGVNRSQEGNTMSDDKKTDAGTDTTETRQEESKVASFSEHRINQDRERKVGAKLEAQRRADLDDMFARYEGVHGDSFAELKSFCINDPGCSVERAKEEILNAIAEGYVSVDVTTRQVEPKTQPRYGRDGSTRVQPGEDAMDKFARAAEVAIAIQANGVYTEEERAESQKHELHSMSVTELAREYLRINGKKATGRKEDIVGAALQRGISHTSSDFASVLENVSYKSMLEGFSQAPESWQQWCQTRNIPDFKTASLLNMSLFGDLDTIQEGSQYEHGDMSDIKETIQLATYGKLFGISRVALANDDLNALSDIPRAMGMAAAYKIGDIAYAVLTTNAALLQDSVLLFDVATHANYITAGAAPSVATLNVGRTAMAVQTEPSGKTLGIRPAYLIGPEALWGTMTTLIAATYDPAAVVGTLTPNPFANSMTVVTDHRLDTANSAGWYLAAATNTVTVGFLNGQQTPYLESRDGWNIDGVEFKVRLDAAATSTDYRGLFYNDGVT